jgi:recombinational DNA repair ATPase RecF
LDDVFSEFDESITSKLHHLLDAHRQVFVTSPVEIPAAQIAGTSTFHVHNGRVSRT